MHTVMKNYRGLRILQTVRYISREVHKFGYRHRAWGYGEDWLTCWYQITDMKEYLNHSVHSDRNRYY